MLLFAARLNVDLAARALAPTTRAFYLGRADALVALAANTPQCVLAAVAIKNLAARIAAVRGEIGIDFTKPPAMDVEFRAL